MTKKERVLTSSMAFDLLWGEREAGNADAELAIVIGKTLVQARFLPYQHVVLEFSDGTSMVVEQTGHAGGLDISTRTND